MTRKPAKPAPAPPAGDDDDIEFPGSEDSPDPTAISINEVLADLAGFSDAVVHVYRLRKTAIQGVSPYEYVAKYPVELFTLDQLRDDHDGGDFRLFINRGRQIVKRLRVSVAVRKVAPAAPAPAPGGPGLEALAAAMREGFAMLLRELAAVRAAPAVDVPALITAAGGMIQTLANARQTQPAAPAPVVIPPDSTARLESMLTLLQKGIELGREAGAPEDSGIFGMIREILRSPLTEAAVSEIRARGVNPQLGQAPAPAPGVTVPPLNAPQPARPANGAGGQAMNPWGFYVGQLVEKASNGADPSLYADLILDNVKPHELREKIDRADWFEWICSLQPNAVHYRAWFDALHAELSLGLAERLAGTNQDSRADGQAGQAGEDST